MQYRAFFSYSRQDDKVANWLHRRLDGYRTPKQLVGGNGPFGPVPAKLHPIYRDRTDSAGGGPLGEKIKNALRNSSTLIVLCSPAAAVSPWVEREVSTFLGLQSDDRIFPVIAWDLPDTADVEREYFPPSLRGRGLLAADLREIRLPNGKMVGDGRDGAKLKLIAGLLHVDLDTLIQRERVAERRRRLTAYGVAAALGVLALVAAGAGAFAVMQRDEAVRQQSRAEKGEAVARDAQALAERNAEQREEQRVIATRNAEEANAQRAVAVANAKEATAQRDRAYNTLIRTFAERSWEAIDRGDYLLGARYALAGWRLAPANVEHFRAALGAALQAGHDQIIAPFYREGGGYEAFEISSDGRRMAVTYDNLMSNNISLWRLGDDGRWSFEQDYRGKLAAFSPDGARVLVGTYQDGFAKVYDIATEKELVSVPATEAPDSVRTVSFAPDGRKFITTGRDTVVWETGSGRELLRLMVRQEADRAVFTPDGRFIIGATGDDVRIYDATTGEERGKLPDIEEFGPHPFSPDGSKIVGLRDSRIVIVDIAGARTLKTIENARGYVGDDPSFSPDGTKIIAPSEDQTAVIWDSTSGVEYAALRGHADLVWSASYGPDGSIFTSAGGAIRIWTNGPYRQLWAAAERYARAVAIDANGPHVAIREQSAIRVVHVASGKTTDYPDILSRVTLSQDGNSLLAWRDHVVVDMLRPDGTKVSLPGLGQMAKRHLIADVEATRGLGRIVTSYYPENINWPRQVMLWDGAGKQIAKLEEDMATEFRFSPSGDKLLVASDETANLYDASTGRKLVAIKANSRIDSPLFSPDGRMIATATGFSAVLWDARTGAGLHLFEPSGEPLAFSPNGRLLAFSSGAISETGSGALRVSIPIHPLATVFSPDATRLLSVLSDGVQVWDSATGHQLATLEHFNFGPSANSSQSAWVSADGKIAFGHLDGGVIATWDISRLTMPMRELATLACERFLPERDKVFLDKELNADPLIRELWQPSGIASRNVEPARKLPDGSTLLAVTREGFQMQGGKPRNVCTGEFAKSPY